MANIFKKFAHLQIPTSHIPCILCCGVEPNTHENLTVF